MKPEPTYIYENDKTYIMVEGSIIGAVDDDALIEEEADRILSESATHVTTPNGLKGKILGRMAGVWGDQVTVRFENGRIVQLPVNHLNFSHEATVASSADPIDDLSKKLSSTYDSNIDSFKIRKKELSTLKAEARELISSKKLSTEDLTRLGELSTQAEYEIQELDEAIAAHEASLAENFEAIAPYRIAAVEQGGPSKGDSAWLYKAAEDIQNEIDATDFEKLMDEGPEVFMASVEPAILADAGATRSMASGYLKTRTAGIDNDLSNKYERVWLERVEILRRKALSEHKETVRKEAQAQNEHISNLPDDAIFL